MNGFISILIIILLSRRNACWNKSIVIHIRTISRERRNRRWRSHDTIPIILTNIGTIICILSYFHTATGAPHEWRGWRRSGCFSEEYGMKKAAQQQLHRRRSSRQSCYILWIQSRLTRRWYHGMWTQLNMCSPSLGKVLMVRLLHQRGDCGRFGHTYFFNNTRHSQWMARQSIHHNEIISLILP